jgi:hypothetical protein
LQYDNQATSETAYTTAAMFIRVPSFRERTSDIESPYCIWDGIQDDSVMDEEVHRGAVLDSEDNGEATDTSDTGEDVDEEVVEDEDLRVVHKRQRLK